MFLDLQKAHDEKHDDTIIELVERVLPKIIGGEPIVEPATAKFKLAAKDTFRILIMDTVEHTDQLKTACKNAGHSVVAAQSIKEAFAFLDGKDHADVIVCAAYLEDESVFEFLKRLRSHSIHKHSMFMILALAPGPSGVQLNHSVEISGRSLGADAFINMPVFDSDVGYFARSFASRRPRLRRTDTSHRQSQPVFSGLHQASGSASSGPLGVMPNVGSSRGSRLIQRPSFGL